MQRHVGRNSSKALVNGSNDVEPLKGAKHGSGLLAHANTVVLVGWAIIS